MDSQIDRGQGRSFSPCSFPVVAEMSTPSWRENSALGCRDKVVEVGARDGGEVLSSVSAPSFWSALITFGSLTTSCAKLGL